MLDGAGIAYAFLLRVSAYIGLRITQFLWVSLAALRGVNMGKRGIVSCLDMTVLGAPSFLLGGRRLLGFDSNKVRALLIFLAVEQERGHGRDKIAGLLWPNLPMREARTNLRYALYNLRQVLAEPERVRQGGDAVSVQHSRRTAIQPGRSTPARSGRLSDICPGIRRIGSHTTSDPGRRLLS